MLVLSCQGYSGDLPLPSLPVYCSLLMSWKGLGQTGGKAETLFAPEEGKERGTVWIRHGDSARWVLLGLLE